MFVKPAKALPLKKGLSYPHTTAVPSPLSATRSKPAAILVTSVKPAGSTGSGSPGFGLVHQATTEPSFFSAKSTPRPAAIATTLVNPVGTLAADPQARTEPSLFRAKPSAISTTLVRPEGKL